MLTPTAASRWIRLIDSPCTLPLALFAGAVLLGALASNHALTTGAGALELGLAERSEWVFAPQHLLATAFLRLVLAGADLLGLGAHHVGVMHALGTLLGAAAVLLMFLFARRLSLGQPMALLAAAVLALSNAFLQQATSGSALVMSLPFALGALVVATGTRARPVLSAALLSASVALSGAMVMLLPALVLLTARRVPAGPQRFAVAAGTVSLALVLGLTPFVLVAWLDPRGPAWDGFFSWLLARSDSQALAGVTGGPLQLPRAIAGIGRLLFAPSDGESAVRAALTGEPGAGDTSWQAAWSLARNLAAAGLLLGLGLRAILRLRATDATLALALGLPVLLAAGLGSWWLSSDPGLWLPVFPLLLALAALGAPAFRFTGARWLLPATMVAAVLGTMASANRCQEVPSLLCGEGGADWRAAARAARSTSDLALVMGPTGSELLLVPHFRPLARALPLDHAIPQDIDSTEYLGEIWAAVQESFSRGGRVFVQGLSDPLPARLGGAWAAIESKHGVSRAALRRLIDHEFRRRPAPEVGVAVEELLPRQLGSHLGHGRGVLSLKPAS